VIEPGITRGESDVRRLPLLAFCLLFGFGCGETLPPDQVVPIDQVPAPILEAAKKQLPGYKFEVAYKIKVGDKDAYEIRGKNQQGKTREVEIGTDGTVLEVE
jgi:hypothetical protein